ncbi:MAG: thioredoxin [Bacteroidaceae bacterium]|nr:thioredoxin [Bacteroidaceae bacterium]
MLSCGGNKAKQESCNGDNGHCTEQHEGCSGNHEGCTGDHENCTGNHEGCTGDHEGCTGDHEECTGGHEGCTKHASEAKTGSIKIDTDTFIKNVADFNNPEWKYLGDKPAIVDFYADWCGPCKQIAPILEEIAKEYDGKLYVYKVNVDENKTIADAFKISAIPTLLFIPMQGEPKTEVGMTTKDNLEKIIKENLLKN